MAARVVIWIACVTLLAVGGCAADTADPEPTTPAKVASQLPEDTEMVRALEDLAAKPTPPQAGAGKHDKPVLGGPRSPEKMCSKGACPSGYRCGYVAGHPRKVCYAAEAHRAGRAMGSALP